MTLVIEIRIKIPAWLERIGLWLVLRYRRLRLGSPFRKIPLTQGKFALVDPQDYPALSLHTWHANCNRLTCYAQRKVWDPLTRTERTVKMHRQILNVPDVLFVDHINHNGLDNRKANLRPATHAQNAANTPKSRTPSSSKYKGVTWHKHRRRWHARIRVAGRTISLGYFTTQTDAALAYDRAAKIHHGPFAALNFPS